MKAHIVIAVGGMHQPGDDMLSRVLLHIGKPLLPVQLPFHGRAGLHRLIRHMNDAAVFFLHIQHLYSGAVRTDEHTRVRTLAAALREEGGTIQHQAKVLPFHAAGKHLSREGVHMAVRVI